MALFAILLPVLVGVVLLVMERLEARLLGVTPLVNARWHGQAGPLPAAEQQGERTRRVAGVACVHLRTQPPLVAPFEENPGQRLCCTGLSGVGPGPQLGHRVGIAASDQLLDQPLAGTPVAVVGARP